MTREEAETLVWDLEDAALRCNGPLSTKFDRQERAELREKIIAALSAGKGTE